MQQFWRVKVAQIRQPFMPARAHETGDLHGLNPRFR
jgi:hypothetical protein